MSEDPVTPPDEIYSHGKPVCRRCFIEALGDADLTREISDYIASLPDEIKTGEPEYSRRLAVCSECDALFDGCCKFCGCFAEVRAAKKKLHCPNPSGDKWQI